MLYAKVQFYFSKIKIKLVKNTLSVLIRSLHIPNFRGLREILRLWQRIRKGLRDVQNPGLLQRCLSAVGRGRPSEHLQTHRSQSSREGSRKETSQNFGIWQTTATVIQQHQLTQAGGRHTQLLVGNTERVAVSYISLH